MVGRRLGARLAHVALLTVGIAWCQAGAQSLDLSAVNQDTDWAAGCGTDAFGVYFCAVQKSNGPQGLGYVLTQREGGVSRQIRVVVNSNLIDAESPVTIQVDENEPLIWPVGYRVIGSQVISLSGDAIVALLRELETGESVTVTVVQKTGEALSFELSLEGFNDAITALEQTQIGANQ